MNGSQQSTYTKGSNRHLLYLLLLTSLVYFHQGLADEYKVRAIRFIGASAYEDNDLLDLIHSEQGDEFDARLVKLDKIILSNFYRESGFITVEIGDSLIQYTQEKEVEINYLVNQGKRYYLGRFEFHGNEMYSDDYLENVFSQYEKGAPFNESKINDGRLVIENDYYNNGKPFINIKLDYRFEQDSLVVVIFTIRENQTVVVKDRKYLGMKLVHGYVIMREMEINKGDIYSREKIEKSQQNIYATGLFDYVRCEIKPIEEDTTQVELRVIVREKDPRWVGLRVGFAYEQEESYGNKLELTAEGGHRNLFGSARSISLHLVPSFLYDLKTKRMLNPENEISLVYVEPWIGYTRTPGILQIAYHQYRPQYSADFNVFRSSINISHKYKGQIELSGGIQAKIVDQLTIGEIDSTIEQDVGKDQIYSLSFYIKKDTRNNYLNPSDGSITDASVSLSKSYGKTEDGDRDDKTYLTLISSWQRYQPLKISIFALKGKVTLANRIKAGALYEFGAVKSIPISDLFFAGGATTVRGYEEQLLGPLTLSKNQAIGGKLLFLSNIEIRIPLFWEFVGELFIDGGNVWREIDYFRATDIKASSGAGIALLTPIGVIRFDYGVKLFPEKYEDNTAYHFGFSFAF